MSVIIPTRDRSALVVEAIESVLAQTFGDLEVVVCDDGSTDDTERRVRALGPRVRYLRMASSGRPGAPRNRAIAAASGELLAFLDDDDLWKPEKLARQVELLDRTPGLDLVYTDRGVVEADGTRLEHAPSPDPDAEGRLLDEALGGRVPHTCTLLVRRAALGRIGGWDETLETGEDVALWLRLGRSARAARVPQSLVLVRRSASSISARSAVVSLANHIGVLEQALSTGDLTARQRLRTRRTLALLHARLALAQVGAGDRPAARHAALRGIARYPVSRNAWRAAARVWLGRG